MTENEFDNICDKVYNDVIRSYTDSIDGMADALTPDALVNVFQLSKEFTVMYVKSLLKEFLLNS